MEGKEWYYAVEPTRKRVSKDEFMKFLESYPRKLRRDVYGACDPPSVTYNDFELADRWPYSIVASTFLYDPNPGDYFYEPEEERVYTIMTNFADVFNSRTGNRHE